MRCLFQIQNKNYLERARSLAEKHKRVAISYFVSWDGECVLGRHLDRYDAEQDIDIRFCIGKMDADGYDTCALR